MSGVSERAVGLAYAAGWRLTRVMPERPMRAVFNAGAGWFAGRRGPGPRRLAANLRRVVGPEVSEKALEELTKRAMQSYARYWYEAFRLPEWGPAEIQRRFVLENAEELDKSLAGGNGTVVALPHAGNWDLAGAWATLHGFPVTTVAERLKPEEVYQRFLNFRRSLGMEIVPLTGGSQQPLGVLTERLREGRLVVLLADRDLSTRGIEVDFFGARTKMPAGPAALALRTGAPLYALAAWNDATMARARLIGPLDTTTTPTTPTTPTTTTPTTTTGAADQSPIAVVTQRIADALASGIAEHPVDWHMLQPLWLADLPARRRKPTGKPA